MKNSCYITFLEFKENKYWLMGFVKNEKIYIPLTKKEPSYELIDSLTNALFALDKNW